MNTFPFFSLAVRYQEALDAFAEAKQIGRGRCLEYRRGYGTWSSPPGEYEPSSPVCDWRGNEALDEHLCETCLAKRKNHPNYVEKRKALSKIRAAYRRAWKRLQHEKITNAGSPANKTKEIEQ